MSRLVSQLLFLCREDTGIGVSDSRPLQLESLVRDVVEHMEVAAREKGVGLQADLGDACLVKGDADRLRQLFFNVLDNAIKYTHSGGSVIVKARPAHGQACVTVTDTGIGIPSEHLPNVFERFYRVDPSRGKTPEGNGLGLAICWAIAESHAGRLAIDSKPGIGTRVTVTLPICTGDAIVRTTTERLTAVGSDEPAIAGSRDGGRSGNVVEPPARGSGVRHSV